MPPLPQYLIEPIWQQFSARTLGTEPRTRLRLKGHGLLAEISQKGKPSPLGATKRWVVERTSSWHNAHKKLEWCMERRGRVGFWVTFSEVVIIVRRLIREGWIRYRWEGRPSRRP